MNLEIIPVRDLRLETAATDGRNIYFDIDFLSGLNQEERVFVFAHEVWHNLMCHFARTESRDRTLMNIATDLEVNQILTKDGMCVPDSACMPDKFNLPSDLCAEEYYELLLKQQQQQTSNSKSKSGNGNGSFDKHIFSGDDVEQEKNETKGQTISDKYGEVGFDPDFNPGNPKDAVERTREAAVGAAQVLERTRGKLPAYIKGLVEALLKPEINWREQLQQFVTRTCCGENRNWNPPNRRHVHSGVYLQSRKGEKIRVTAGLDVSGSTSRDIPKFLGELDGLVKSFGKYSMSIIQCDTEVKRCDLYTDDDPLDLEHEKFEYAGGGGTTLSPIFDKIEDLSAEDEKPDAIVILTDGYCEKFTEDMDPGIPVLWLVTKGGATDFTEFGDVVEFKESA